MSVNVRVHNDHLGVVRTAVMCFAVEGSASVHVRKVLVAWYVGVDSVGLQAGNVVAAAALVLALGASGLIEAGGCLALGQLVCRYLGQLVCTSLGQLLCT